MKYRVYTTLIFIGLFIAGGLAMHVIMVNKSNEFSCTSRFITQTSGDKLSMIIRFVFNKDDGIAILDGVVLSPEGQVKTLSRKITFSYYNNESSYFLTAKSITIQPDDNIESDILKRNLPGFYLTKGSTINYGVYYQKPNGYVFATGRIPSFYCSL